MVRTEHDIVSQVQAAKTDSEAADALIRQYMGFIRSETVKFPHTAPENGHEDELSIAMLAFYEAVLAYEKSRGAFLPYAARAIKNRLIDHYRTEKRHGNVISLHTPLGGEEDGGELLDTIPDTVDHAGDYVARTASRREIQEFSEKLAQFGLTFSDVADNCPRQERTFAACRRVLDFARTVTGCKFQLCRRPEEAAVDADVVITDVWASMGQEEEKVQREKAFAGYQVNADLMALAHPGAMVQHCLPAHREEEITAEVFEAHAGEIFDEAENRLHAQKAVMYLLMGEETL